MLSTLPSGTVTFLVTDIVQFSAMFERDEASARSSVLAHFELIRELVAENDGRVFKTVGDAAWAAFESAPKAVRCALAILESIDRIPGLGPSSIRVALLTGEATPVGDDYLDRVLNRCSRICGICKGGEILVGAATFELTLDHFGFRPLGPKELKGIPAQAVYQLLPGAEPSRRLARSAIAESDRPFIGRAQERAELLRLLRDSETRLVTVTGLGGMGKTTLAKQVAQDVADEFVDGVTLVPCEGLEDADALLSAIWAAVEPDAEPRSATDLAAVIDDRQLLLVLDCFESLVRHRALIDDLVRLSRKAKFLVTSRAVLGLPREFELALGPMANLADACELFYESAAHVTRSSRGKRPEHSIVTRIVALLDCVPLAIVLAASRLRHLTAGDLLAQVESRRLGVLRRPPIGENDRHQDLNRVIADSFDLLSPAEQTMLTELSVFRGFFLDDAVALLDTPDVFDGIATLRENSLLVCEASGRRTRYRILDTVREHLLEQRGGKELRELRARHAAHYTSVAERLREEADEGHWRVGNATLWLEMGNLREAMRYARERDDHELALRQARCLARPFAEAGMQSSFDDLVIAAGGIDDAELGIELAGLQGILARRKGRTDEALALWARRSELCRTLGDMEREADSLTDICDLAFASGRLDIARDALLRYDALPLKASVHGPILASGKVLHAELALLDGDNVSASRLAREAIATARKCRPHHRLIYVYGRAADISASVGEDEAAREQWWSALLIAAEANYPHSAARILLRLSDHAGLAKDDKNEALFLAMLQRLPKPLPSLVASSLKARLGSFSEGSRAAYLKAARQGIAEIDWRKFVQANAANLGVRSRKRQPAKGDNAMFFQPMDYNG